MNKIPSPADALQQAMLRMIQTWMQEHPIAGWLIAHPLWSLGLLLGVILLLRGLFGAIGRLTERIWLAILRFPVRLATWLLTSTTQLLTPAKPVAPTLEPATQQERLTTILARLEAIQQEQDTLLKEVRAMLESDPVN